VHKTFAWGIHRGFNLDQPGSEKTNALAIPGPQGPQPHRQARAGGAAGGRGLHGGRHRSPYHGFSSNLPIIANIRKATTRGIWTGRIYAKANRYYIKQYEVETNFVGHILHDASESMLYGSPAPR